MATSCGGAILGSGSDIVILDDILKVQDAVSVTERTKANTYFYESVSTRLNEPSVGLFIVICQRLSTDDIVGSLLENQPEEWDVINLSATLNENTSKEYAGYYQGGLFFPERFPQTTLDNLKKSLGSFAYSAQYGGSPVKLGGNMVKKDWIQKIDYSHPDYKEIIKTPVYFTVDSAYTKDELNDKSAILAYHVWNNNIYIKAVMAEHLEFPELLQKLQTFVKANGYTNQSKIYTENKASGKSLVQQIRHTTNLNILEYTKTTKDKITKLNEVLPQIESGRVFLLPGNWHDSFLGEVCSFPRGKNDDQTDCLVMALNKKGGSYHYR